MKTYPGGGDNGVSEPKSRSWQFVLCPQCLTYVIALSDYGYSNKLFKKKILFSFIFLLPIKHCI